MPNITEDECRRRVNEFLDAHSDQYTEREKSYIRRNATWLLKKRSTGYIAAILRQVYDETELLPDDENMYITFVNLLEENFDINRNIVEVAGGIVPTLAKKIALRQETGTITVYDPRVITPSPKPDNLRLQRQMFNRETSIPDAHMLIGFMPCDATNDIIESACKNDIDFMIALCEGGDRKGYEWLETDDEWIEHVMENAKRHMKGKNMGTLEVASLERYGNPYPIIYNKRRKS